MSIFTPKKTRRKLFLLSLFFAVNSIFSGVSAQIVAGVNPADEAPPVKVSEAPAIATSVREKPLVESVLPKYYDAQSGLSVQDLIDRALAANGELVAARLEIEKARSRLAQANLRPNPTLEIENVSGRLAGSPGESSLSAGVSLPIEIYGRRQARISVAQIQIEASRAEVRNRERILISDVLNNYAEALAALRELEATERLLDLDLQTTKFVQIRVNEGDSAPLELSLLQAEVERLRAKRQLAEGRLEPALTQLKLLAGLSFDDPLRLREQIGTANLPTLPPTRETAIDLALRMRPDVALAQIEEQSATAGLRLVRAQAQPDLTVYTRYSQSRSSFDNTPIGTLRDSDRAITFGVSLGLPIFNKNQGAKAEAELAIRQAQGRREFAEKVVRAEVIAAYQRFEAASRAVDTLENSVLPRVAQNVETFRKVYELGQIQITDLIAEQRRLLDANRDLTDALTERYRARSSLNIALGADGLLPPVK